MLKIVKKDGTLEDYNLQKVVNAVKKSAYRALVDFTQEELDKICNIVDTLVKSQPTDQVPIAAMHNIVESALEQAGC